MPVFNPFENTTKKRRKQKERNKVNTKLEIEVKLGRNKASDAKELQASKFRSFPFKAFRPCIAVSDNDRLISTFDETHAGGTEEIVERMK